MGTEYLQTTMKEGMSRCKLYQHGCEEDNQRADGVGGLDL